MRAVDHQQVKALLDGEALEPRRNRLKRLATDIRYPRLCSLIVFLFCLLLVLLVYSARLELPIWTRNSVEAFDNIPIASRIEDARILILQHTYHSPPALTQWITGKSELPLYEASISTHQRYAQTWGYGYKLDRGSWLSGDSKQSKHLSKVYALLNAVLEELDKGEVGAEWIM